MAEGVNINHDRADLLLTALVARYIDTGEPVSSASLSKDLAVGGTRIPPSTIRMELSRLERKGYLVKPHRSGGRMPTASAYRKFVDSINLDDRNHILNPEIQEACRALSGEIRRLLEYAGEVLAEESGCLGFVTSPSLADAQIAKFKLDAVERDVLLLRLELASGRSYHNIARLPVPVAEFRIDLLKNLLSERLSGRRLSDVSDSELAALVNHAAQFGRGYDIFVHPLHDLITSARLGEGPITVMHGAAGLLRASGEDPETLARAVAFLDDRSNVEKAIGAMPDSVGVNVVIGGDYVSSLKNREISLDGLALVFASYHIHARARGQLGILGPLRMPYPRQLTLVKSVSDLISRVLISRELSPGFG